MKSIRMLLLGAAFSAFLPAHVPAGELADHHKRGLDLYNKKDYAGAAAEFSKAIELDPHGEAESWHPGSAYLNRGGAYFNQGEYDKAIADYDAAIKLDPSGPVGAQAFKDREDAYAAKKADTRGEELEGGTALDYYNRGLESYSWSDFSAAIRDLTKAAELDGVMAGRAKPYLAQAYGKRGDKALQAGEYAKAITDYDSALSLNSELVQVRASRAEAVQKMNGSKAAAGPAAFGVHTAPVPAPEKAGRTKNLVLAAGLSLLALTGGAYLVLKKYGEHGEK